jgi:hypothetical protein
MDVAPYGVCMFDDDVVDDDDDDGDDDLTVPYRILVTAARGVRPWRL